MKRTALVCSLVVAMAVSVLAGAAESKQTKTVPRAIYGELDGAVTFVPVEPYGPMNVIARGEAVGPVSHIGVTRLYSEHRPAPDGTAVTDGRFRLVAANGDQIWGTYEGPMRWEIPGVLLIGDVPLVIEGGTGRFAHASGTIQSTVHATFLGFDVFVWPFTWVLDGTFSY